MRNAPSNFVADLYSEHHGWLATWLRAKMGNAADAADLAHDTFLRVLTSRNDAPLREPRGYLATVARGLMVDRYRRQALERAYLEALAVYPEPMAISEESHAIIIETLCAVDRLLHELGSRTREIFLLAKIEGLTQEQIGAQLRLSQTTVRKHLARAYTACLVHAVAAS